jgi:hypothetical protein
LQPAGTLFQGCPSGHPRQPAGGKAFFALLPALRATFISLSLPICPLAGWYRDCRIGFFHPLFPFTLFPFPYSHLPPPFPIPVASLLS